jgi:hypothetical protein
MLPHGDVRPMCGTLFLFGAFRGANPIRHGAHEPCRCRTETFVCEAGGFDI